MGNEGKESFVLREVEVRFTDREVTECVDVPIEGQEQIIEIFKDMQNATKEKIIVVSLDGSSKITCYEVVAVGSVSSVLTTLSEVLRTPIATAAKSIIVVHNHPSGDPTPSSEDIKFTARLKEAADLMGLNLLDHIIIGNRLFWSMHNAPNTLNEF